MMPGLDGVNFVQYARRIRPWLPILLLTGRWDIQLVKRAIGAGAYDFIFKPVDRELLVLALMRALEVHGYRAGLTSGALQETTVFILGLPASFCIEQLRELLAPFGGVVWGRITVNSNDQTVAVALAEMVSPEAANRAIRGLGGAELRGSLLRVGYAKALKTAWTS
jgi:DNA-binding response OmpR family regulator